MIIKFGKREKFKFYNHYHEKFINVEGYLLDWDIFPKDRFFIYKVPDRSYWSVSELITGYSVSTNEIEKSTRQKTVQATYNFLKEKITQEKMEIALKASIQDLLFKSVLVPVNI
jgi:hypothetical protein